MRRLPVLLALVLTASCAQVRQQVAVPIPTAAQIRAQAELARLDPSARLGLEAQSDQIRDQRVADVAFRLAAANTELCPDRAALTGLTLQTLSQYIPAERDLMRAQFGGSTGPAVLAVAAGSPAQMAGLQQNDVLLAVDGWKFASPGDNGAARNDDTFAAEAALTSRLSVARPARLTVLREEKTVDFFLTPVAGCLYQALQVPGSKLARFFDDGPTSYADDRHAFITGDLIGYARDNDELAILMGHEFAHMALHHIERAGASNSPAAVLIKEREADYVGLYLAARAGYEVAKAPALYRRLSGESGPRLFHPSNISRAAALALAVEEIRSQSAVGGVLIPRFKAP